MAMKFKQKPLLSFLEILTMHDPLYYISPCAKLEPGITHDPIIIHDPTSVEKIDLYMISKYFIKVISSIINVIMMIKQLTYFKSASSIYGCNMVHRT